MRGRHAVIVAVVGALAILFAAPLTSLGALGSLVRGTGDSSSVDSVASTLSIPTEAGEIVTIEQADVLPPGQVAYELADGPRVLVREDRALPPIVTDDVKAEVLADVFTEVADRGGSASRRSLTDARDLAKHVSDTTGKRIVLVFQDATPGSAGAWLHSGGGEIPVPRSTDLSRVVAQLEDWVAAQDDAERFEIIVVD